MPYAQIKITESLGRLVSRMMHVLVENARSKSLLAVLALWHRSRRLSTMARPHGALSRKFRPSVLPGQERKDLATPRHETANSRRRSARRETSHAAATNKKQSELQLNVISSLLAGAVQTSNAFQRCLYKDALGRSKKVIDTALSLHLPFACKACEAKQPRDCICSGIAILHGKVNIAEWTQFCQGVRSPFNPIYTLADPADQVDLQNAFEAAQQFLDSTTTALSQAKYVVRLAYIAAMSGLAATVEASAPYLTQKKKGLKRRLDTLDVVHRGGQCPGTIVRGEIATQLPRFMKIAGNNIAQQISACSASASASQRQKILCNVATLFSGMATKKKCSVDGCGAYKCKRILEAILLAGLSPIIAVPHILHSDLLALAGCWPLPAGSRSGLARIMPGMNSTTRQQQGLKALSLAVGSGGKGKSVPVPIISAMLCFWNEHKKSLLRWVPHWCLGIESH